MNLALVAFTRNLTKENSLVVKNLCEDEIFQNISIYELMENLGVYFTQFSR